MQNEVELCTAVIYLNRDDESKALEIFEKNLDCMRDRQMTQLLPMQLRLWLPFKLNLRHWFYNRVHVPRARRGR